jgi:hypothetical protein
MFNVFAISLRYFNVSRCKIQAETESVQNLNFYAPADCADSCNILDVEKIALLSLLKRQGHEFFCFRLFARFIFASALDRCVFPYATSLVISPVSTTLSF